jgi:D-3-phosphoglycerate dehydrogenase
LKIIARGGVGLDNIDKDYAESKGIKVINTPAASSQSVAELVFSHMFNLARFLHLSNREMPSKGNTEFKGLKKSYSKGMQLRGKTLGIIGFGRIGQQTARIGVAMGMKVLPVDLMIDQATIELNVFHSPDVKLTVNLETVDMDDMLKECDFLTLHVPFSGGKPIIGKEEIAKMKNSAFIINTARGGTVDEAALLEAINNGELAGAGLDVFDEEPTPSDDLINHPKISVTPHTGASTLEAQSNIGLELADKILSFFGDDK